jgi:hypothetical protein
MEFMEEFDNALEEDYIPEIQIATDASLKDGFFFLVGKANFKALSRSQKTTQIFRISSVTSWQNDIQDGKSNALATRLGTDSAGHKIGSGPCHGIDRQLY